VGPLDEVNKNITINQSWVSKSLVAMNTPLNSTCKKSQDNKKQTQKNHARISQLHFYIVETFDNQVRTTKSHLLSRESYQKNSWMSFQ
jgi:hypothetical protein